MSDPSTTIGGKLLASGIAKGTNTANRRIANRLFSSDYKSEFATATTAFDEKFRTKFDLYLKELRETGQLDEEVETDWEKLSSRYSVDQLDSPEEAARDFVDILLNLNRIDVSEHSELRDIIHHEALIAFQEGYDAFLAELKPEPAQVAIFDGQQTVKQVVEEIKEDVEKKLKTLQKPTRATRFEIGDAAKAADQVLQQSFAECIEYVSRGEFDDFSGNTQCVIFGPEQSGKTRCLAWLTQNASTLYDVDEIIVIGRDYTHQTDYPAVRELIQGDNVLVVWDDITTTPGRSSVDLFSHTVNKLYNDVPGTCHVICSSESGQGLEYKVNEILSSSGEDTCIVTLSMPTSSQLRQLIDSVADYYDVVVAEADRDTVEKEIRSRTPLPGAVVELVETISTDTDLLTADAIKDLPGVSEVWKYRYRDLDTVDKSLLIASKLCHDFGLHQRRDFLKRIFIDVFDNRPLEFADSLDRIAKDGWIQPIVPNRPDSRLQNTEYIYIPAQRLDAIAGAVDDYYYPLSNWVQNNCTTVSEILSSKTAADLNYNLALRLMEIDAESERIVYHLEKSINSGIDDPDYHIAYGVYLGKIQEDAEEIKTQFQQAYNCAPGNSRARFYSALGYLLDLEFKRAAEQLTSAVQIDQDCFHLQHLLQNSGFSDFIQSTLPLFEKQRDHTALIALAVYAYLEQDKLEPARELSIDAASTAETGAEYLIAARALDATLSRQDEDQDSDLIRRITNCYHFALAELASPTLQSEFGAFCLRVEAYKQAVTELQEALEGGDKRAETWSRFATALTYSDIDTTDSENWRENPEIGFQMAVDKQPQQPEYRYSYIDYLKLHGRFNDAVQQFEWIEKLEEMEPKAQIMYAETLYKAGAIEEALKICEEFRYSDTYSAEVQMLTSQLRHNIKLKHGPGWGM
ncbi:hypothetical protein NGM10_02085 [Halorussus salilacus]|uniref:tetratricopeptide repeat protein n=1 Tax=Halorussus salilacus TaxID=2953750 RepID=UPI0020A17564|nr:tetratricopeptide repeat protein [Halorussus salilacus]USZ68541.1 hypothetical protein NGM10_02085 [Halorussus salilacus]